MSNKTAQNEWTSFHVSQTGFISSVGRRTDIDSVEHLESSTDVYLLSFGQKAYTVRAGARTCLYYESDYS